VRAKVADYAAIGVCTSALALTTYVGSNATSWSLFSDGNRANNAAFVAVSSGSYGGTALGTFVDVWVDFALGYIWYGFNGLPLATGSPEFGVNPIQTGVSGTLYPAVSSNNAQHFFAFVEPPLTPGFKAW
jgi:hypothetical protein